MPPAYGCLRVQSTQGRDKWAVRQQPWRWRAVFRSWMVPLAANSAARLFWLTNQRRHNATGCHPNVRPQDPQTDHGQVLRQKRATAGWSVSHEMSRSQPARGNGNCWRGMRIRFCWNDSKCTDQPNAGGQTSRDPQCRSKRNLARVDPSSAGHHDRPTKMPSRTHRAMCKSRLPKSKFAFPMPPIATAISKFWTAARQDCVQRWPVEAELGVRHPWWAGQIQEEVACDHCHPCVPERARAGWVG